MLGRKLADGLQFHDDLLETDEVRRIALSQQLTFVPELKWPKADKWNSPRGELEPKAFLIDRLKKASAERSLHLEDGAANSEGFLGADEFVVLSAISAISASSVVPNNDLSR